MAISFILSSSDFFELSNLGQEGLTLIFNLNVQYNTDELQALKIRSLEWHKISGPK